MRRIGIMSLLLITVCVSSNAQRLHLFNDSIRNIVDRNTIVVMDFVERYFNGLRSLKGTSVETKLADDKMYFRKGKWTDIYQLNDTLPVSFSKMERYFEISWLKSDVPFLTFVFPAQYDLIVGKSQKEIQNGLRNDILSASSHEYKPLPFDTANIKALDDKLYVKCSQHIGVESLNNARYFIKTDEEYYPVYDDSITEYSAANLFHGLISNKDYRMHIEQSIYGMTTTSYDITLSQWLKYCSLNGLKTYFAVEEEREDGILAIIIAQNDVFFYNHLLSVVLPKGFVNNPKSVLKVKLTPYIPTHNIKNLYKQQTENNKRKQWQ